jgi:hypothetical protein
MLNYLSSLVDIILKNFASEENKQFILALEKAWKNSSNIVFPNFASVSYSRIYPYQRASMDMWWINWGLGVAYFYRTNRDEEWKYFTGTQEVISCNEYNTLDIRKAFFDYICYDINSWKYKIINDVDNPNNWPIIDIVPWWVKAN